MRKSQASFNLKYISYHMTTAKYQWLFHIWNNSKVIWVRTPTDMMYHSLTFVPGMCAVLFQKIKNKLLHTIPTIDDTALIMGDNLFPILHI